MRILVVEDDPVLAEALGIGLRNDGYAVDLAPDGIEAEFLLQSNPYDCVLLDIMVPGKDGWDLLKSIRGRSLRTPVVCLTARDSIDDRVKGLDLGADDYVQKPFVWKELKARLRSVIRRSYDQPDNRLVIGDLEIDTVGRVARRGGTVIPLTGKEFALLQYLALRAGQVVTRAEIIEHLYGEHDQSMSNVVDVFVGYVRAKLDRGFEQKLIHTRRGQGYILTAGGERGSA